MGDTERKENFRKCKEGNSCTKQRASSIERKQRHSPTPSVFCGFVGEGLRKDVSIMVMEGWKIKKLIWHVLWVELVGESMEALDKKQSAFGRKTELE